MMAHNLKTIVFLSKEIFLDQLYFHTCNYISYIAFPYATSIKIYKDAFAFIQRNAKICVLSDAKIDGNVNYYGQYLNYIEKDDINQYVDNLSKDSSNESINEIDNFNRYIVYLKDRLGKYENPLSMEEFLNGENK